MAKDPQIEELVSVFTARSLARLYLVMSQKAERLEKALEAAWGDAYLGCLEGEDAGAACSRILRECMKNLPGGGVASEPRTGAQKRVATKGSSSLAAAPSPGEKRVAADAEDWTVEGLEATARELGLNSRAFRSRGPSS